MPDNFGVSQIKLEADVATDGTVTLPYPAQMGQLDFTGDKAGPESANLVFIDSNSYQGAAYLTYAYNADDVIATNTGAETWHAGADAIFQMPRKDAIETLTGLTPLDAAADLPTTVAKVNEIIFAMKPPAPVPVVSELSPNSAVIGGADLTLAVRGSGFQPESIITFNGGDEPTTYVSSSELTTLIKPSTAGTAGEFPVGVKTGSKASGTLGFMFTEAGAVATTAEVEDETEAKEKTTDKETGDANRHRTARSRR